jgi:ABC-type nitrate/sulfonate/bicarbonate transport system ATPase subunit
MSRAAFQLINVSKTYTTDRGSKIEAISDITISGEYESITCLVGPTGSGKSTILRLLAGLERAGKGEVFLGGRNPEEMIGSIGFLTQFHNLLPWLKVEDNITLPLKIRGIEKKRRKKRGLDIAALLGLSDFLSLHPHELSGGMAQRVALGRLLASETPFWLLDEPFSSLDEKTTHQLQNLLLQIIKGRKISLLFVTHSIDEAVYLADRVIILSSSPGRVTEVIDVPMKRPRNRLGREYADLLERIRRNIESAIEYGNGKPW